MADEQTKPPFNKPSTIPMGYDWQSLLERDGDDLEVHYHHILETPGKEKGMLGVIFRKSQNKIQDPVRRKLLHECDVHTLLRLPTGIFYAQGVKANVLFFDRKPASEKPWTEKLWIYDLRTNKHFTLKTNPLRYEDLQDFIECYNPEDRFNRGEKERFKAFTYNELIQRDKVSLDIFWLKDESLADSKNLPDPDTLAVNITESLESALEQFRSTHEDLNGN